MNAFTDIRLSYVQLPHLDVMYLTLTETARMPVICSQNGSLRSSAFLNSEANRLRRYCVRFSIFAFSGISNNARCFPNSSLYLDFFAEKSEYIAPSQYRIRP